MSDLISRQAAIDECDKQYPNIDRQDFKAVINAVPSAEVVLQTPQTYGKSINPNAEIVSDIISRQDAIKAVENLGHERWSEYDYAFNDGISKAVTTINALPSADRPTGEWVKKALLKDTVYDLHVYKCSCCGVWGKLKFNYCPNCGAKMRGGTE